MRKIDALLGEYGESHQNATNKTIHWVCVPLIFFSLVCLIASIPSAPVQQVVGSTGSWANWAGLLLLLVSAYYFSLSYSLTIGMVLFSLLCLFLADKLSKLAIAPLWAIALGIFIVAWIGQFYGHRIEGKKPSFLKDLQFLLIGPAWLMHFIYKKIGVPY